MAESGLKFCGGPGRGDLAGAMEELEIAAAAASLAHEARQIEHWLGPGRTLTLARYELFLMAARDATLRPPLVTARDRFVALAAEHVGASAAPTVVAAVDGLILDALVRGHHDPGKLRAAVIQIAGVAPVARARGPVSGGPALLFGSP